MTDPATTYAAVAAMIMATVAVLTIVMRFWPKSLRPLVERIDNEQSALSEKNKTLEKEVLNLKSSLKEEVDQTDKDIERLNAKNEKLTDLMIRILQDAPHK